jgi:hypothetical protein
MAWLDWLLRGRKKLLESPEPERAFAPDPQADYWPLASGSDNEAAYTQIRDQGICLVRVGSGQEVALTDFAPGALLFATMWEPYSAKTIGALKHAVDAGEWKKFGIVFFENTREEVIEAKQSSWYYPQTYILAAASFSLRGRIGRVPFRVFLNAGGQVERIAEGKL